MRRRRSLVIGALISVLALLVPVGAAGAQGYQGSDFIFTATPGSVEPGGTITFSGSGCEPGAAVTITSGSSTVAATTATGTGAFSAQATAPTGNPGLVDYTATCGAFSGDLSIVLIALDTFGDVPPATFFSLPVAWAFARGITTGVGSTGEFQPGGNATRAEQITFIWRMLGAPSGNPSAGFTDVPPNTFFTEAANWAAAQGLTTGVGGQNIFEPNREITRAEVVTFLWRLAGSPGGNPSAGFTDVPSGTFYTEAVNWAKANNITTGVGGGNTFEPNRSITRAEVVTFLFRTAVWGDGAFGPATLEAASISFVSPAVDALRTSPADSRDYGQLALQLTVVLLVAASLVLLQTRKRRMLATQS